MPQQSAAVDIQIFHRGPVALWTHPRAAGNVGPPRSPQTQHEKSGWQGEWRGSGSQCDFCTWRSTITNNPGCIYGGGRTKLRLWRAELRQNHWKTDCMKMIHNLNRPHVPCVGVAELVTCIFFTYLSGVVGGATPKNNPNDNTTIVTD